MNVHSLSNPSAILRKAWRFMFSKTRLGASQKGCRAKPQHSALGAARRPCLLRCISTAAGQDFVSHAAFTECETTGTGCAAGSKLANGSGVGCPMNWKIAAAILKMHVANTAVSIAPKPFSSELARIPYNDWSFFIMLRRRELPALSVGCWLFMIGFENWMRPGRESDSNNCRVQRSETSLVCSFALDEMIRDSSRRSE